MKKIGMIGGMSWESSVTYYQVVNRVVKEQLGKFHSAECLLYSVDFQAIEECQIQGDWDKSAAILGQAAKALERAGADFFIICTNTMHKVADQVQAQVSIPFLHIADLTANELLEKGISRVGLLGTIYTMEQDFYSSRLESKGIKVLTPCAADRKIVNSIIFDELCLGKIMDSSRKELARISDELGVAGALGIVLGCTEIGLCLRQQDATVPLFDTAVIHATRAAMYAIS